MIATSVDTLRNKWSSISQEAIVRDKMVNSFKYEQLELPLMTQTPATQWAEEESKHALDELFNSTITFRKSEEYYGLLKFIKKFRFYSPYNAFLIRIQRPGATFVAPARRWRDLYKRRIRPGANPIMILQPMGPVMFVFDVSDTEPEKNAKPLPSEIERPFEVANGLLGPQLEKTTENAKRDGIRITNQQAGSQRAGSIQWTDGRALPPLRFQTGRDKSGAPVYRDVKIRFDILLNGKHSRESQYSTLVHELAHLYCGHIGTPNPKWWPDRRGLSHESQEFEAESVAYLVCSRIGIDCPSAKYLSGYIGPEKMVPDMSVECVMKTAGLIENMGNKRLKLRKKE